MGTPATAEGDIEDCVRATLYSMDSSVSGMFGKTGGDYVAGYIFEKIGEKTVEEVGSTLSTSLSVAELILDVKESYENSAAISGALDMIDASQAVDALGIHAGVISVRF